MRFFPPPRFSHQQKLSSHSHTTSSSPFSLHPSSYSKLFFTGATIGPLVDSLHNQCLLQYHVAPIQVAWPTALTSTFDPPSSLLLASSWLIPPLLGMAYIVLGRLLPQVVQTLIQVTIPRRLSSVSPLERTSLRGDQATPTISTSSSQVESATLRYRAILAVLTTALIIQGSDYLERHPTSSLTTALVSTITTISSFGDMTNPLGLSPVSLSNLLLLLLAALTQWVLLDGSVVALLSATIASIGGPLSELPFVGHDVWQYLPTAADYFPLQGVLLESSIDGNAPNGWIGALLEWVIVGRSDPTSTTTTTTSLASLGLSSLTGPCYFAVTMDAIALGRWFAASEEKQAGSNK